MEKFTANAAMKDLAARQKLYNPNTVNATTSGLVFIIALVVNFALSIAFNLFVKATKIEPASYLVLFLGLVLAQLSICAIALITAKIKNVKLANGGGFACRKKPIQWFMGIMLIFGLMAVVSPVAEIYVQDWYTIWGRFGITPSPTPEYTGNIIFGVFAVLLTPILPAIFEEWLYRGIIMKGLREFGDITAIILSSLMFAIMHGSMEQFIYQFIVGFAIGGAVMLTGNYFVGCAMHFANNLFAQIFAVCEEIMTTEAFATFEIMSIIVGAICIMVAVCYFIKFAMNKAKRENAPLPDNEAHYFITNTADADNNCKYLHYGKTVTLNDKNSSVKTLFLTQKGELRLINNKSNKITAWILVSVGIALGLALIIISDFGFLAKLIRAILKI